MNKKVFLIIFGLVILGVVGFVAFRALLPAKQNNVSAPSGSVLKQNEGVIPTVDSSVQVDLVKSSTSKDVTLKIQGIPTDTQAIDYELSYEEKTKGLQGAIGSISVTSNEKTFSKQITLGTCSSGKCVYHEVVGKIKVTLKFSGPYGEKAYENEYAI